MNGVVAAALKLITYRCLASAGQAFDQVIPPAHLRKHTYAQRMPIDDVRLRSENPADVDGIRTAVVRAFGLPVIGELVDGLRASPDWIAGLSFVAEREGRIIGHVLFTRSLLDAPQRLVDVLVLSPVSVTPEEQGKGVGSALIQHGLEAVSLRREPLVFLEGSPTYYARFGFKAAGSLGFRRPSLRIPEPAFQVLPLPAYEPWMTGTLVYSRVFWDLDSVGLREVR